MSRSRQCSIIVMDCGIVKVRASRNHCKSDPVQVQSTLLGSAPGPAWPPVRGSTPCACASPQCLVGPKPP